MSKHFNCGSKSTKSNWEISKWLDVIVTLRIPVSIALCTFLKSILEDHCNTWCAFTSCSWGLRIHSLSSIVFRLASLSGRYKFCSGGIGILITFDKIHSLSFKITFKPISFEPHKASWLFSSIEKSNSGFMRDQDMLYDLCQFENSGIAPAFDFYRSIAPLYDSRSCWFIKGNLILLAYMKDCDLRRTAMSNLNLLKPFVDQFYAPVYF